MASIDERRAEYRQAYDDWQKQLAGLHEVLLEGKPLAGDKMKGLLNREARAKDRYDHARLELLGIGEPAESPFD